MKKYNNLKQRQLVLRSTFLSVPPAEDLEAVSTNHYGTLVRARMGMCAGPDIRESHRRSGVPGRRGIAKDLLRGPIFAASNKHTSNWGFNSRGNCLTFHQHNTLISQ